MSFATTCTDDSRLTQQHYDHFRRRVDRALERVRKVLSAERCPRHPADVAHTYEDKYLLAEIATRAALAGQALCFAAAFGEGRWAESLARMRQWAAERVVSFSFSATTKCAFVKTETRKVDSATQHVTETSMFGNFKSKTVTTVIEHFWKLDIRWRICAYAGADPQSGDCVELAGGAGSHIVLTTGSPGQEPVPPKPEIHNTPPDELNASWLVRHITEDGAPSFDINRGAADCCTPRRNTEVIDALRYFNSAAAWLGRVSRWFRSGLFGEQQGHSYDLSCISAGEIFDPVLATFSLEKADAAARAGGTVVSAGTSGGGESPARVMAVADFRDFLAEQQRSLGAKAEELAKVLPAAEAGELISAPWGSLVVALDHAGALCGSHGGAVGAIESMLRNQLIAAIGREIGPSDFAEYMDFHNRQLFRPCYRPRGFCFAVRRPQHFPEGVLSIEAAADTGAGDSKPIQTFIASSEATQPMSFPLSAAADLQFLGERHLHACVLHRFGGQSAAALRLCARARQFSSFVVLVGKIAAADAFDPQAALIVQNKDDLTIPLLLETIPTPKEFRDAVESLSPEQRKFAKAFRSMQLASTVFGVLIIQIKPQLERLLNLPNGALTKEVELTQHLMELFVKYQLSSDLISFDGDPAERPAAKVAAVKENVKSLRAMISAARERELAEQEEEYRKRMMERPTETGGESPRARPGRRRSSATYSTLSRRGSIADDDDCCGCFVFDSTSAPPAAAPSDRLHQAMDGLDALDGDPCEPCEPEEQFFAGEGRALRLRAPATGKAAEEATRLVDPAAGTPAAGAVQKPPGPQQQQPTAGGGGGATAGTGSGGPAAVDYTALPRALDRRFEQLDDDSAVRPTIIKPAHVWTRQSQAGLISDVKQEELTEPEQRTERDKAYDLLDALSRSGALPVECASLHVVLAATHCFEESLVNTVVQKNVNPIERAERSCLIMSSTVQGVPAAEMLEPQHVPRVEQHSRRLFAPP
eukprot:TRINITY_DN990_c0_g1_i2.p1 TRINITY_DN990_c0_g1~~TRINITY_DN990_c0_g1_i2.p1  ORF type:complete len:988 (+),score=313.46 TRINITY_DN990_c0_g1_i2:91-3054(+)